MNKTKKAILEASIKVFSLSGYNGATVDEIAAMAGVAKGTLYYNFKSKEEIFNFVINEGLKVWEESLIRITKSKDNPIDKLKNICRNQLTLLYNNKEFFKIILSQLWGQEVRQLELRDRVGDYIKRIENILKEAAEKNMIKQGNITLMAHTFFGSLVSAIVYEFLNIDKVNLESIIEELTVISIQGIIENK